jgi:hypothetical protein
MIIKHAFVEVKSQEKRNVENRSRHEALGQMDAETAREVYTPCPGGESPIAICVLRSTSFGWEGGEERRTNETARADCYNGSFLPLMCLRHNAPKKDPLRSSWPVLSASAHRPHAPRSGPCASGRC